MSRSPSILRLAGRLEGVSFLLLLGIAMPLKYLADRPEAVKWLGWAHGLLFIWYVTLVARAWRRQGWPVVRPALLFLAALLPFGPFLLERRLTAWESAGVQPLGDH